jgi:hypothetical protein
MRELDELDGFEGRLGALEAALGGSGATAAAFEQELRRMQAAAGDAGREVSVLSGGISRGLRRAFDGLVFDGMKLSDALRTVGRSMVDAAYSAAIRPVANHFGGMLAGLVGGALPFAQGAGFTQGRVMPFARGGVVSSPMAFPMRGGMGLMGEAGPEAILPLARGADGRLGVRSQGGAAVNVTVNVSTPDVEGFRRSQTQIAAQVARAIQRGQRNR